MRSIAIIILLMFAQNTPDQSLKKVFARFDAQSPGAAVLIRRNGKTTFRAYGIRDLRSKTPNDARTNFRLASCTKQFTATAIMLLVHDGKLHYDDRLTDVLPEFPAYGKTITIRNLLNHTSGIPDYESLMEGGNWTPTHQISDAEVLKLLEAQTSGTFPPGSKWSYSNSGYVVLGLVVARVSGKTFPQFLHDRIFQPLKMDHTLAYVRGVNEVPERAYGHSLENGHWMETDQSSTSATLGDGGVYSNLEDLAKWDDALRNHTLLTAEEMKPALTPVTQARWSSGPGDSDPLGGKPVQYGFGWFLDPYKGRPRMWHYGDTVGFNNSIQRFADGTTIIVLCNRSDVTAAELATGLTDALQ